MLRMGNFTTPVHWAEPTLDHHMGKIGVCGPLKYPGLKNNIIILLLYIYIIIIISLEYHHDNDNVSITKSTL